MRHPQSPAVTTPLKGSQVFFERQSRLLFKGGARRAEGVLFFLIIRRSKWITHPGRTGSSGRIDICFPGGAVEAGDSSTLGTALRELEEEIGVPRSKVSVLGPLDYVESPVGVLVWPYAARLLSTDFAISRGEIDHLFTVPVDWFAKNRPEIAQIRLATRPETGFPADLPVAKQVGWKERRTYDVLIYRYGTYKIWGITAAIIVNFLEIVK